MSRTISRYVIRLFLSFFAFILLGVTLLYVLIDYGDRQRFLTELSTDALLRLYFLRGVLAMQQLAPAAMLLASGATHSALRQRGEWTALQALGVSRWQTFGPVVLVAAVIAGALVVFDDQLVTRAGLEAKALSPIDFQSFAARPPSARGQRWFKLDSAFLQVRGAQADDAFRDVTIYEVDGQFRLQKQREAQVLKAAGDGRWVAEHVETRTFGTDGTSTWKTDDTLALSLGTLTRDAFRLSALMPEELRLSELGEQVRLRERLGMPYQAFTYMEHLRFAYPATGVAAVVLAALLALRAGRRGHLTLVLVEGVAVAFLLLALLTVSKSLVMNDRIAAPVAAWMPVVGLLLAVPAFRHRSA